MFGEFRSDGSGRKRIGFASQLLLLIDAFHMSLDAKFVEDFISGSKTVNKSSAIFCSIAMRYQICINVEILILMHLFTNLLLYFWQ